MEGSQMLKKQKSIDVSDSPSGKKQKVTSSELEKYNREIECEYPILTEINLEIHMHIIAIQDYINQFFDKSINKSFTKSINILEIIFFMNVDIIHLFYKNRNFQRYEYQKEGSDKLFKLICERYENVLTLIEQNKFHESKSILGNYSKFLSKNAKYDLAESISLRELDLLKKNYSEQNIYILNHLLFMAKNYERMKKFDKLDEIYKNIKSNFHHFYSTDSDFSKSIRENIDDIQRILGKKNM